MSSQNGEVIDRKIVSMEFQNNNFQKGVKETKNSIENLVDSFKTIDNSSLQANLSLAKMVMQITLVRKATEDTINATKKLAKAITITPMKGGLAEYELLLNSTQTILANTKSAGTTLDQVNSALDELNHYADLTIYNFSQMTQYIGAFTSAGVGLNKSVESIKGIANLAAVAGANAEKASSAMNQLAHSISGGYIRLKEWNSLTYSGLGGKVFQDALKDTARTHGVAVDAIIKKEGSFQYSLKKGWATTEIITDTLKKFTISGANEYLAKFTGTNIQTVEAMRKNADASEDVTKGYEEMAKILAKNGKLTETQIKEILDMSRTAEKAATEVKTFSGLMSRIREMLQTGWTTTWRIIIGDYNQAKEIFTGLADTFSDIINEFTNARNEVVGMAMNSSWETLVNKMKACGASVYDLEKRFIAASGSYKDELTSLIDSGTKFEDTLSSGWLTKDIITKVIKSYTDSMNDFTISTGGSVESLSHYAKVVDDVINGKYGDSETRLKKLTEEGYNYNYVMALVSAKLNNQTIDWENLTTAEIRNLNISEYQKQELEKLNDTIEDSSSAMNDIANNMDRISGRKKMLSAIQASMRSLTKVINIVSRSFNDAFGIKHSDFINILDAIESISLKIENFVTDNDELYRTLKGIFSLVGMVTDTFTELGKILFVKFGKGFSEANFSLLTFTASIGDHIVKLRSWLKENNLIVNIISILADTIINIGNRIGNFLSTVLNMTNLVSGLEILESKLTTFFLKIKTYTGLNLDFLLNPLRAIININNSSFNPLLDTLSYVINKVTDLVRAILNPFKWFKTKLKDETTDIDASMVGMFTLAEKSSETIKEKITRFFGSVVNTLIGYKNKFVEIFGKIIDYVSGINLGAVLALAFGLMSLRFLDKIILGINALTTVIYDLKGPIAEVQKSLKSLTTQSIKLLKRAAFKMYAEGILALAESVFLLAASLFVLGKLDSPDLGETIKLFVALIAVVIGMGAVVTAVSALAIDAKKVIVAAPVLAGIMSMLIMILGIAHFLSKNKDFYDPHMLEVTVRIALLVNLFAMIMSCCIRLMGIAAVPKLNAVSLLIASFGASVAMIVFSIGSLSNIVDNLDLSRRGQVLLYTFIFLGALLASLLAVSALLDAKGWRPTSVGAVNASAAVAGPALSILAFAFSIKIIIDTLSSLNTDKISKIKEAFSELKWLLLAIAASVTALLIASQVAGKFAWSVGVMVLGIAVGINLLIAAIGILGTFPQYILDKGTDAIKGILFFFGLLIAASHLAGQFAKGAAVLVISVAGAIMALTGVIAALGLLDINVLLKGGIAVGAMILLISLLVLASSKGGRINKNFGFIMGTVIAAIAGLAVLANFPVSQVIAAGIAIGAALMAIKSIIKQFTGILKAENLSFPMAAEKGLKTLMGIIIAVGASMAIASFNDWKSITASGASIVLALLSLSLVIKTMAALPSTGISNNAKSIMICLTVMMGLLGATIGLATYFNKDAEWTTIAAIGGSVALGILAVAAIMALMPALLKAIEAIPESSIVKCIGILAMIGVMVVVLGGVMGYMISSIGNAQVGFDQLAGLALVILAMAGVATALAFLSKFSETISLKGLLMLSLGLGIFLGATTILEDVTVHNLKMIADMGPNIEKVGNGMESLATAMAKLETKNLKIGEAKDFLKLVKDLSDDSTEIKMPEDNKHVFEALEANIGALAKLLKAYNDKMLELEGTEKHNYTLTLNEITIILSDVSSLKIEDNPLYKTKTEQWSHLKEQIGNMITTIQLFSDSGVKQIKGANLIASEKYVEDFSSSMKALKDNEIHKTLAVFNNVKWQTWSNFKSGLDTIVEYIKSLSTAGSEIVSEDTNLGNFDKACTAIERLSKLQAEVPEDGGFLQKLLGSHSWVNLANGLSGLGTAMKNFSTNIKGYDDASMTQGLGYVEKLYGIYNNYKTKLDKEINWGNLGKNIAVLGTDLKLFSNNLKGYGNLKGTDFESVGKAIENINDLSELIGNMMLTGKSSNGLAAEKIDFTILKTNLTQLSGVIEGFSSNMKDFKDDTIAGIDVITHFWKMLQLFDGQDFNYTRIQNVFVAIRNTGNIVKDFNETTKDINASSFHIIANGIETLVSALSNMGDIEKGDVSGFESVVKKLLQTSITDLMKVYSNYEDEFKQIGKNITESIKDGLNENKLDLKTEFHAFGQSLIASLTKGIEEHENLLIAIDNLGSDIKKRLKESISDKIENTAVINGKKVEIEVSKAKSGGNNQNEDEVTLFDDVFGKILEWAENAGFDTSLISKSKLWTFLEDKLLESKDKVYAALPEELKPVIDSLTSGENNETTFFEALMTSLMGAGIDPMKFLEDVGITGSFSQIMDKLDLDKITNTISKTSFTGFSSKISQAASDARSSFDEYFDDYKEGRISQMEFDEKYANGMADAQNKINKIYDEGLQAIETDLANEKYKDDMEQYAEDKEELYKDYTDALQDLSKHTSDKIRDYAESTMEDVVKEFEDKIKEIQKKMDDFSSNLKMSVTDALTFTTKGDVWDKEDEAFEKKTDKMNESIDKLSESKDDISLIYGEEATSIMQTQEKLDELIHTRDKYEENSKEWRRAQKEINEIMYGQKDDDTKKKIQELKEEQKQYQIGSEKWKELEKQIIEAERGFNGLLSSNQNLRYFANLQKTYDQQKYQLEDSQKEYEKAKKDRDEDSKETIESVQFTNKIKESKKKLEEYENLLKELRDKPGISQELLSQLADLDTDKGIATVKYWLSLSEKELNAVNNNAKKQNNLADSISKILYGDEMRDAIAEFYQSIDSNLASLPEAAQNYGYESIKRYIDGMNEATIASISQVGYNADMINKAIEESWSNEKFILSGLGDRLGSGMQTALMSYMCSDKFKMALGENTVTALLDGVKASLAKTDNQVTITPVLHMPTNEEILTPINTLQSALNSTKLEIPTTLLGFGNIEQSKTVDAIDSQTNRLIQGFNSGNASLENMLTKIDAIFNYIETAKYSVTLDKKVLVGELGPSINKQLQYENRYGNKATR